MITVNIATIVPVVLYGHETWSHTEVYRTRVLGKTLSLREVRKRERQRPFSEVYGLYSSLNVGRVAQSV